MNILIVDDDRDLLTQTKMYLENKNDDFDIKTSHKVEKALEMLDEQDFDIIVSDYQMPSMDGLEFLEFIRNEKREDIPFIIFTGKGREEVAMKALNLGANRYIQKGGETKTQYGFLSDAIKQEYEHHRKEKELEKSEKEKSLILENVDEIIAYHDLDHNIIWANRAYREATGLSSKELEGKNCYHVWGLDRICKGCPVSKAISEGKPTIEELSPENQKHWPLDQGSWLVKGSPVKDEYGNIIGGVEIANEITEKLDSEKKLKESREYYKTLVETSPEAIMVTDLEGKIIDCNKKNLEMQKIGTKDEILGKNALNFIIPEDRQRAEENLKRTLKEGEVKDEEYTLVNSEGNEFPAELSVSVMTNGEGEPDSFMAIIKDISKRENAIRELKKKDKYLDYIPEFVNVIDKNGNIVYRSKSFLGDNILESDEINDSNIFEFVHPDDREKAQEYFFKSLKNPGEEFRAEIRGKTKDGWTWFEGRYINYLEEEPVNGIIVTGQDISERKEIEEKLRESEEKYRRVTENINDVITLVDQDGKILYGNEKAYDEVLGYDVEDMIGENGFDFFYPDDKEEVLTLFRRCIEEGNNKGNVEARFRCKDGSYKWLECSGRFFSNGSALIVSRDITEKREARDHEKFLHSILRHDVKNKLQVAKGYLQLTEEGEEIEDYTDEIIKSIDSAQEIIKKVRTLQKLEESERVKEINLGTILDQVISEYYDQIDEKGIDIESESISGKIEGGSLIHMVFSNIIENSIKHSGCNKIKISLDEDEDHCTITIEDDGKGLSKEQKERIFERGYKEGDESGSGLGLYLVKKIIERYDGSIEVKDSDMGGVGFKFKLKKSI